MVQVRLISSIRAAQNQNVPNSTLSHHERVTSYVLRVTSYVFRVTYCVFHVSCYMLLDIM